MPTTNKKSKKAASSSKPAASKKPTDSKIACPPVLFRPPKKGETSKNYMKKHAQVQEIYNRILSAAFVHTDFSDITVWAKYYSVIEMASQLTDMQPHLIVYPFKEDYSNEHCIQNNDWIVQQKFNIRSMHYNAALDTVQKAYNNVIKKFNEDISTQPYVKGLKLAEFQRIRSKAFSPILRFFHDFWLVHPELTAEEAFDKAKRLERQRYLCSGTRLEVPP